MPLFTETLESIRTELDFTKQDFSAHLGLGPANYFRILKGDHETGGSTLRKIVSALPDSYRASLYRAYFIDLMREGDKWLLSISKNLDDNSMVNEDPDFRDVYDRHNISPEFRKAINFLVHESFRDDGTIREFIIGFVNILNRSASTQKDSYLPILKVVGTAYRKDEVRSLGAPRSIDLKDFIEKAKLSRARKGLFVVEISGKKFELVTSDDFGANADEPMLILFGDNLVVLEKVDDNYTVSVLDDKSRIKQLADFNAEEEISIESILKEADELTKNLVHKKETGSSMSDAGSSG